MKHVVLIKANKPEKFNYCKFGNYKDVRGKNVELVDINDNKVSGWEMFQPVVSLDINETYDKRVYEFLQDHPLIKGNFIIEDLRDNEQKQAEIALKSAEAITTASSLSDKEMSDVSILLGLNPNLDSLMLKANIIKFANSSSDKFLSLLNDMDKEHRVFLKKALEKGVLSKPNGVWKHGTLNVGLTDDQAIVWLKDNADVYALLKHQLRTGKIEKVEEEVEEVAVVSETIEPSSISSSTMKELEKDIENK
tara:strand:- start:979 stop:1728 length:750 start_codon:yes stop_codon:yes gene_type:complete